MNSYRDNCLLMNLIGTSLDLLLNRQTRVINDQIACYADDEFN